MSQSSLKLYLTCCAAVCVSLAHCLGESLSLDYQNIEFYSNQDAVELGVRYDGDCSHFIVETFTRQDIIDGGSSVSSRHNSTVDSSAVNVSLDVLNQTQPANYVRIAAASEDGDICSDDQSQQSYYHFVAPDGIRKIEYEPFSTVEVPIPTTHCDHPVVVWPRASTSNGEQCYCLSLNSSLYSFEDCVEECQTHHNVTLNDSSIFFHDLNMMSFLVHFVCDEDPCFQSSCILETVVASYRITLGSQISISTTPTPQPFTCKGAGHTNGCCTGPGLSDCLGIPGEDGRLCYCDAKCHESDLCCDDIREIKCYPSNCSDAGKLDCSIGNGERCEVEVAPNSYCYCNRGCEDCCDDYNKGRPTIATAGLGGATKSAISAATVSLAIIITLL